MNVLLARVVETCPACPSQWDAWTVDGHYLYLRYRFGRGTVEKHATPDPDAWDDDLDPVLSEFGEQSWDGSITLADFCARAGLTLAPDAVLVPWDEYVRNTLEASRISDQEGRT